MLLKQFRQYARKYFFVYRLVFWFLIDRLVFSYSLIVEEEILVECAAWILSSNSCNTCRLFVLVDPPWVCIAVYIYRYSLCFRVFEYNESADTLFLVIFRMNCWSGDIVMRTCNSTDLRNAVICLFSGHSWVGRSVKPRQTEAWNIQSIRHSFRAAWTHIS